MPIITVAALVKALPLIKSFYDHVQVFRKNSKEIDDLAARLQTISTYIAILKDNQSSLRPDLDVLESGAVDHLDVYVDKGVKLVKDFPDKWKITRFVLAGSIKTDILTIYDKLGMYEQGLIAFCSVRQLKISEEILKSNEGILQALDAAKKEILSDIRTALEQKKEDKHESAKVTVVGVASGGKVKELIVRVGGVSGLHVNIPFNVLTSTHLDLLSKYQASLVPYMKDLMNSPMMLPGNINVTAVESGAQADKVEERTGEREFMNMHIRDQPPPVSESSSKSPEQKRVATFKEKLLSLKKDKYQFSLKSVKGDTLSIQLSNGKEIKLSDEEVEEKLQELIESLKSALQERGVSAERYECNSDLQKTELTLVAEPVIRDIIAKIIWEAGDSYLDPQSKIKATLFGSRKPVVGSEVQSTVDCKMM